jgi:dTDP-4-amino-4,6-dideoxygalactose transaminase
MGVPFLDLNAQHQSIGDEIKRAIDEVIDKAQFIMGEQVSGLEQEFAAYCGTKYAVGTSSGTTALHLALLAGGIEPNDEVITTPHTFIATAEAISHAGAYPLFIDIDERSYNLDVTKLARFIDTDCEYDPARGLINRRSRRRISAVIPVHLYGQPVDMDPLLDLAGRYGLKVIEDAAQAHGARCNGKRTGGMGDAGVFSFYPGKNLGGLGDGGMVVTNNEELAQRVRLLANHGRRDKYRHLTIGYNYRLDALQAAVLRVKLKHLDNWNQQRRSNARRYDELLADCGVITPQTKPYAEHVYHLYVIRTERRDELRNFLAQAGIRTGIHYPLPLHLQPAYSFLGYQPGDFPVAENCARTVLSLPMYPELEPAAMEQVVETIHKFLTYV